jgi:hypothetical protein
MMRSNVANRRRGFGVTRDPVVTRGEWILLGAICAGGLGAAVASSLGLTALPAWFVGLAVALLIGGAATFRWRGTRLPPMSGREVLIGLALILGWYAVGALLGIPSSGMTAILFVWLTSPIVLARIVARLIDDRLARRGGLA